MNFEDELRATMRIHDTEAPRVADLPPRPWQRRRPPTWLLAAAAAVVVAVVAVPVAVLNGSGAAPPSAAGPTHHSSMSVHATAQDLAPCPTKYRGTGSSAWVPALPSGVDGSARLVPATTPAAAAVCAYLHGQHEALTGQKALTGGLADLATQLTWLPRQVKGLVLGCTADLQITDGDAYLLELQYPAGHLWVAVDGNHCSGASNGQFTTVTNLRVETASAYGAGRWPAAPDHTSCTHMSSRLSGDHQLVAGTPASVLICNSEGHQLALIAKPRSLVATLDRLPTKVGGYSMCFERSHATDPNTDSYELHFRFVTGPDLSVLVRPWCTESVQSEIWQSPNASAVVAEIHRLLGKR